MNCRDFIQVRTAAHAAGHVLRSVLDPPAPPPEPEYTLLRFARRAMATEFEVLLPWGTPAAADAAEDALDLIDRLEAQLTIFRDSSEVSRLNRLASVAPVPVEASLFELLALSSRITAETGGAFDVTAWPVGIKHPWQPERRMAVVRLRDRAMATSGATYQHFEYNGRKLGHLLDPRTGRPAEGIALATAFAPSAAEADALATAFYVLGVA